MAHSQYDPQQSKDAQGAAFKGPQMTEKKNSLDILTAAAEEQANAPRSPSSKETSALFGYLDTRHSYLFRSKQRISSQAVAAFEQVFLHNNHPSKYQMEALARQFNEDVSVWFNNRRGKSSRLKKSGNGSLSSSKKSSASSDEYLDLLHSPSQSEIDNLIRQRYLNIETIKSCASRSILENIDLTDRAAILNLIEKLSTIVVNQTKFSKNRIAHDLEAALKNGQSAQLVVPMCFDEWFITFEDMGPKNYVVQSEIEEIFDYKFGVRTSTTM